MTSHSTAAHARLYKTQVSDIENITTATHEILTAL